MAYQRILLVAASAAVLAACTPTVRIEPSDKPIKIDLNVKIDQTVRIQLDREVEDLIANNPDLF
ncbi:MAG: YnbE family lipoprotein [Hyphomonas sp.]|uniref:YnbE family lipoprotein n=1 Tax=Hyphomonas sp. TaxID=87 RepID=UPI0017CB3F73|nr:YnbE family lipoprotein [Hyphomonas sp.]MBA3068205.1 YnbE family lipoprotein [Hyphomonas sp.]MBU3921026.1 YnbE family lipoprotein [Alphaproteobacteria bacterium]MBU4060929.1 YnbE family lipoprotein [Alphaproteobacteria bacterium]MBU4164913.1 YnbE family lipoprotein [Alphaproteobacteria bacterium]